MVTIYVTIETVHQLLKPIKLSNMSHVLTMHYRHTKNRIRCRLNLSSAVARNIINRSVPDAIILVSTNANVDTISLVVWLVTCLEFDSSSITLYLANHNKFSFFSFSFFTSGQLLAQLK